MPPLYRCVVAEPVLLSLPRSARMRLAWAFVSFMSSLYYLLPLLLLLSIALATLGQLRSAAVLGLFLVGGIVVPLRERPFTRRLCQAVYEIFDVRHNVSPERVTQLCDQSA